MSTYAPNMTNHKQESSKILTEIGTKHKLIISKATKMLRLIATDINTNN